jgi:hypothetical protein
MRPAVSALRTITGPRQSPAPLAHHPAARHLQVRAQQDAKHEAPKTDAAVAKNDNEQTQQLATRGKDYSPAWPLSNDLVDVMGLPVPFR